MAFQFSLAEAFHCQPWAFTAKDSERNMALMCPGSSQVIGLPVTLAILLLVEV
jgi:hypothetical protein